MREQFLPLLEIGGESVSRAKSTSQCISIGKFTYKIFYTSEVTISRCAIIIYCENLGNVAHARVIERYEFICTSLRGRFASLSVKRKSNCVFISYCHRARRSLMKVETRFDKAILVSLEANYISSWYSELRDVVIARPWWGRTKIRDFPWFFHPWCTIFCCILIAKLNGKLYS